MLGIMFRIIAIIAFETTYLTSKIVKAINDRLDKTDTPEELTERQLLAKLLANTKDPVLKAICQIKLNPHFDEWIVINPNEEV